MKNVSRTVTFSVNNGTSSSGGGSESWHQSSSQTEGASQSISLTQGPDESDADFNRRCDEASLSTDNS